MSNKNNVSLHDKCDFFFYFTKNSLSLSQVQIPQVQIKTLNKVEKSRSSG